MVLIVNLKPRHPCATHNMFRESVCKVTPCTSLLSVISCVIIMHTLKITAFSELLEFAREINCHFLINRNGDLSFFFLLYF